MIDLSKISNNEPNNVFVKYYEKALNAGQKVIEGISISTFNKEKNEVDSRFVNLKYIIKNEWIFFSNYNSVKAADIDTHKQISAVFYWQAINIQIRIKGIISKTSAEFSDEHFFLRAKEKNALAISSDQSSTAESYSSILDNYQKALKLDNPQRPTYWGGYSFEPYYFEFWEGHESRLNKRKVYEKSDDSWKHLILQP